MNCPVCKTKPLSRTEYEPRLYVSKCGLCEGFWVSHDNYSKWLTCASKNATCGQTIECTREAVDVKKAKLCPSCNKIMIKYKVGHGTDFFLDQCGTCNGVWFDRQEWNQMTDHNLHTSVPNVFTQSWQREISRNDLARTADEFYSNALGDEEYKEVQRVKAWIDGHPKAALILAFLMSNSH